MVTVTGFKVVTPEDGESYLRLLLEGDLEMIQSDKTGNFYAHVKKCSVSCTFNQETAQLMVGKEMPGSIIRQEVEPYEYEIDGEVLTLKHRWVYSNKSSEDLAIDDLVRETNGKLETA